MFICSNCKESRKGSKQHKLPEFRDKVYADHYGNPISKGKEIVKEKNVCDFCFEHYQKFGTFPPIPEIKVERTDNADNG